MPKFLRESLSYVVVAFAAGALVFTQMPAKVVVDSTSTAAPEYAATFMTAYCARDIEGIIALISPQVVTEATVREVESQYTKPRCLDPRYLGSYQTQDAHVFVAFDGETGTELYWVVTFKGGLVINVE